MQYNKLGQSGLKVSEISLGSYLTFGERVNESDSVRTIHKAFDLGINSFDTANVYQQGEAERILAKALKSFARDDYVIATKAFWATSKGPNSRGLSRKHLVEQVHQSLKRMKLDYVDIFYCHSYDYETPVEETLRTLDDLIKQGKILYVGVSNWNSEQLQEAIQISDKFLFNRIIVNQCEYSLLKPDIEDTIIPDSEKLGLSQIVFSPLAQGILTGKYNKQIPELSRATNPNINKFFTSLFTKESLRKAQQLENLAGEFDLSLTELALSWVLRKNNIASALMGASSPKQVEENVKRLNKQLTSEMLTEITKIYNS
ncbi:aldo/keto reductase family protein [Bacillus sp. 31A1R]|uniref:Aldo/keto reductase family protein n=1 Tax=Robertmurraya mangrovi TaxID=3098077 RepID=A0ABU5ITG3_9BACI|nr:aldo/keto reductase family protein [Bacillus sp. 31A1R]MDZ5470430.1 aldo/keto reductase family protein [Bacillus sp. 31A1R]